MLNLDCFVLSVLAMTVREMCRFVIAANRPYICRGFDIAGKIVYSGMK